MKDLKEFILEKRVKEWQIGNKKVPQLYIHCLNDYLEQIAEELSYHDKQIRKEVVQEITSKLDTISGEHTFKIKGGTGTFTCVPRYTLEEILNQIENGGINEKIVLWFDCFCRSAADERLCFRVSV